MKNHIIVIDTNLWVSAFISQSMRARIIRILASDNLIILADNTLIDELKDVCMRPKFAKLITPTEIEIIMQILHERLTIIESNSTVRICRDPKDDFLLSICLDGVADFLLTGDQDLLILRFFEHTQILSLTEFERIAFGS